MYEDVISELEENAIDFLHPASTFSYRDNNFYELVEKSKLISE
jgi:biotin carboxylase